LCALMSTTSAQAQLAGESLTLGFKLNDCISIRSCSSSGGGGSAQSGARFSRARKPLSGSRVPVKGLICCCCCCFGSPRSTSLLPDTWRPADRLFGCARTTDRLKWGSQAETRTRFSLTKLGLQVSSATSFGNLCNRTHRTANSCAGPTRNAPTLGGAHLSNCPPAIRLALRLRQQQADEIPAHSERRWSGWQGARVGIRSGRRAGGAAACERAQWLAKQSRAEPSRAELSWPKIKEMLICQSIACQVVTSVK